MLRLIVLIEKKFDMQPGCGLTLLEELQYSLIGGIFLAARFFAALI